MKREQAMWFVEVTDADKRAIPALDLSSATVLRRDCLQAHLDAYCASARDEKDRLERYDRWTNWRRRGLIRAVKVTVSWEARR